MIFNLRVFCVIFLTPLISALEVGDSCTPNDQISAGVCTVISDCEAAVRLIKSRNFHSFSRCGFQGLMEVVCCPPSSSGTVDKFGSTERNRASQRIADVECNKIIKSFLPPLNTYIIGGEEATIGEFPHMVALGFDRDSGYQFDCGGSLLSDTFVLTAAHCVDNLEKVEPSIVRVGVTSIGGSTFNSKTDVRISRIIKHPEYTRKEKYHDMALLELAEPVKTSNYVHGACLYTSMDDPTIQLTITGWGTVSTTKDARSDTLLKANVTVVARERCSQFYSNWRKLPAGIVERQICAGDPDGMRDTCQGDSGGPLQGTTTTTDSQIRIIGVTSFGRGCGSAVPGVYTRVAHYLDWIESIVWPN